MRKFALELDEAGAFKPFLMMLMLFTLQQACGSFAVIFYAVNVFQVNVYLAHFKPSKLLTIILTVFEVCLALFCF